MERDRAYFNDLWRLAGCENQVEYHVACNFEPEENSLILIGEYDGLRLNHQRSLRTSSRISFASASLQLQANATVTHRDKLLPMLLLCLLSSKWKRRKMLGLQLEWSCTRCFWQKESQQRQSFRWSSRKGKTMREIITTFKAVTERFDPPRLYPNAANFSCLLNKPLHIPLFFSLLFYLGSFKRVNFDQSLKRIASRKTSRA